MVREIADGTGSEDVQVGGGLWKGKGERELEINAEDHAQPKASA